MVAAAPAQAAEQQAYAAGLAYATPAVVAGKGDTLRFTNLDAAAAHDVDSDQAGLFQSPLIVAGESTKVEGVDLLDAGTYAFHCSIHSWMKGAVTVGADVNARFRGPHIETPLHWAASSNDVTVLDALLDAGADIEAPGAVIADGTPLADARAFGNWQAAHRLVQRGAETTLTDAATLGLMDRLDRYFADASSPGPEEVSRAFWGACHGGQLDAAEYLLAREADLDWVPPWENLTPLDAAQRTNADELVRWLRDRGAKSATELTP